MHVAAKKPEHSKLPEQIKHGAKYVYLLTYDANTATIYEDGQQKERVSLRTLKTQRGRSLLELNNVELDKLVYIDHPSWKRTH